MKSFWSIRAPFSELFTELLRCASELLRRTSEVLTLKTVVGCELLLQGRSRATYVPRHLQLTWGSYKNILGTTPQNLCSTILFHVALFHWRSTHADEYISGIFLCILSYVKKSAHTIVRTFKRTIPNYCWCSSIFQYKLYWESFHITTLCFVLIFVCLPPYRL